MKIYTRLVLGMFFLITALTGCITNTPGKEETYGKISEAQTYFNAVEGVSTEGRYEQAYVDARQKLEMAEELAARDRRKEAYAAAVDSLDQSRDILQRYYRDTILVLAQSARREVERLQRVDRENPIARQLSTVENVISTTNRVMDRKDILSVGQMIADLENTLAVTYSIQNNHVRTVGSDISFQKGSYRLSENGKTALGGFVNEILDELPQNNDKPLVMNIRVIGYTDRLNFAKDSKLKKEIIENTEAEIPEDPKAQRQFLNQRLSELRAREMMNYLVSTIHQQTSGGMNLHIESETIGRGEDIPENVPPPYPTSDPRRRICKIYVNLIPGTQTPLTIDDIDPDNVTQDL